MINHSYYRTFLSKLACLACLLALCTPRMLHAQAVNVQTPGLPGFIANVGQWPSHVLYAVRQNGANVWITRTGVVTDSYTVRDGVRSGTVVREAFSDVNPRFERRDGDKVSTVSFFKGNDKSQWFTAPVVSRAALVDYYPGITFAFALTGDGQVQRSVIVRQGADLAAIRGELLGGERPELADVSPVTSTVYGTYIGGNGDDQLAAVEYLSNGEVVLCGTTSELEFPGVTGGYSAQLKGKSDGFVARLDARLEKVLGYTFIGGSSDDRLYAIAKDGNNNVLVTGETSSSDYPTTSGVTGKLYKTLADVIVAKFDPTLEKLLVGFYHGGNKDEVGRAIKVDVNGVIYVAGSTTSTTNFPVTFPATVKITIPGRWGQPPTYRDVPGGGANQGQTDGFVATFSVNGSMQLSRFFGGSGHDIFVAMAVDKSSSVFLTGSTTSSNFETAPTSDRFASGRKPADETFNGGVTDAFVVKLSRDLTLASTDDGTYSTYFGGSADDEGTAIVVDELGRAYIVGSSTSKDLPAIGTMNTQSLGQKDVFLASFADDGRELIGTTYYGGSGDEEPHAIRMLSGSTVMIAGTTNSEAFPVTGEGVVNTRAGLTDGFLSTLNLATNIYATLVTGNGDDTVRSISLDPLGNPYYIASTTSSNLRTYPESASGASKGLHGYVAKHAFGIIELTAPAGGETYCVGLSKPISWSALGFSDTARFQLQYAPVGSKVWTDVAKNVGGRSYLWKVPALPTGQYVVRVTTIHGHLSELLTPFTISNPPVITRQPVDVSACGGKPAVLTIGASGAGVKYQWRKSGVNVPGATEAAYTIPSIDASTVGKYDCLVSGTCSPSVTSASVNVLLGAPTEISRQPAGLTVDEGKPFTLSIAAAGSTLTYQWNRDGVEIAGATASEYTVPSASKSDGGAYTCVVSGGCGVVTSSVASVVVMGGTSVNELDDTNGKLSVIGPVPADGAVTMRIGSPESPDATLRLVNARGMAVRQLPLTSLGNTSMITLRTDDLPSGVYIVEFVDGSVVTRNRFVIFH